VDVLSLLKTSVVVLGSIATTLWLLSLIFPKICDSLDHIFDSGSRLSRAGCGFTKAVLADLGDLIRWTKEWWRGL
jgi:hypothetical protein